MGCGEQFGLVRHGHSVALRFGRQLGLVRHGLSVALRFGEQLGLVGHECSVGVDLVVDCFRHGFSV